MATSTSIRLTREESTNTIRPCADDWPQLQAQATGDQLKYKLDSNLDRLKAEALYVLEEDTTGRTRACIASGATPEHPDEEAWWQIGYYQGLQRAIEVLKNYED